MNTVIQPRTANEPKRSTPLGATAFLVGVPLVWGVVLLFHPTGEGDEFYPILKDEVTPWLVVHLATMVLLPLMAVVVHQLLRGCGGTTATVSRLALAVFALAYTAWEVAIGVGTGILVDAVNGLTAAERATAAPLVEDFTGSGVLRALEYAGSAAWLTAMVAAAVALRGFIRLHWVACVLLVLSAPLVTIHVPPFGPVGLVLFVAAVVAVIAARRRCGFDLTSTAGTESSRVQHGHEPSAVGH